MARKEPDASATYVRYLLAKTGHTQDDVARVAGVSKVMVSRVIARARRSAPVLRALLQLTGKRVESDLWPEKLP